MKKKLSKQSIFTILGILAITASIPLAVLLVQQRQEIRKEAAACSPPNSRVDNCHYCGSDGQIGLDFSTGGEADWCGCTLTYFGRTAEYVSRCGGAPTPTAAPAAPAAECSGWDSVNCRGCANGHWGPSCGDYGPGGDSGAVAWCACEANCGGGVKSTNCGGTAAPGTPATPTPQAQTSTTCTPGQWSSSLCTRCLDNGQWPQGGISCPAGSLDFGSRNLDGDAGYTDQAHCDCQRRCWGADKMTTNCGGTVPIENAPGNENVAGSVRSWGLYKTNLDCPAPAVSTPTPTPTRTPTSTPTPTKKPTPTPTKPTATPTVPLSCNVPCTANSQCGSNLICSSGRCRNQSCISETDCTCPTPTATPTVTSTPTPTPTTPVSCNQSCSIDSQCSGSLICSSSHCRNRDCTSETNCNCPGPTATPTPGPTSTPTPGPTSTPGPNATPTPTTVIAGTTPTPVVELPKAGFALPTFGFILGGILLIITSLVFIL